MAAQEVLGMPEFEIVVECVKKINATYSMPSCLLQGIVLRYDLFKPPHLVS